MRLCRIPDLIYSINYGINSRIVTYSKISSFKVIVNCSRQSYYRKIKFCSQQMSPRKSSIPTNHN